MPSTRSRARCRCPSRSRTRATPASPSYRPERGADGGGCRAVQQPALALLVPLGAGRVQRVQHPRGAVGEPEPAAVGELRDVAGEEPVLALRGGRGEDGLDHRVAAVGPVARIATGEDGAASRTAGHLPGDLRDRLVEELPRHVRELLRDHLGQVCRLAAVDHEQRGHRQEQGQPQTGQRIAVDVGAPAVRRGEEPGVGDDLTAVLPDRGRGLEVEEEHRLLVRGDHDVEDVQVVEDDARARAPPPPPPPPCGGCAAPMPCRRRRPARRGPGRAADAARRRRS